MPQIRFSPELEINPADFARTWNDSADCKELAEAQVSSSTASYDIGSAFVLLSGIAIGVATNTIYDLLKQTVINNKRVQDLLEKRGLSKQADSINVQTIDKPEGSKMRRVRGGVRRWGLRLVMGLRMLFRRLSGSSWQCCIFFRGLWRYARCYIWDILK